MAKQKSIKQRTGLVAAVRELRDKLHEMNEKLDYLINSHRKFYFTTDFSDSLNHEFKG